jgi:dCMP deaminase
VTSRPSPDEIWLATAALVATRSKCARSQVGCVIVDGTERVVATGYNGPPATYRPAEDWSSCASFCPRANAVDRSPDFDDCPSVHAELNALLYAVRSVQGGTAYLTRDPCLSCARAGRGRPRRLPLGG